MDSWTVDILCYWQNNRASAYFMAQSFIEQRDYIAAISWQKYAAYCHKCLISNQQKAGL